MEPSNVVKAQISALTTPAEIEAYIQATIDFGIELLEQRGADATGLHAMRKKIISDEEAAIDEELSKLPPVTPPEQ